MEVQSLTDLNKLTPLETESTPPVDVPDARGGSHSGGWQTVAPAAVAEASARYRGFRKTALRALGKTAGLYRAAMAFVDHLR